MRSISFVTVILTASLSSACGGGGSGGGDNGAASANFASFIGEMSQVENNTALVIASTLPSSAVMNGHMMSEIYDSEFQGSPAVGRAYVGDARITANFNNGTLVGSANNYAEFIVSTDNCDEIATCTATYTQDLDGQIAIIGQITGNQFEFDAAGTLTGTEGGQPVTGTLTVQDGEGILGMNDDSLVALGVDLDGTVTLNSPLGSETTSAATSLLVRE